MVHLSSLGVFVGTYFPIVVYHWFGVALWSVYGPTEATSPGVLCERGALSPHTYLTGDPSDLVTAGHVPVIEAVPLEGGRAGGDSLHTDEGGSVHHSHAPHRLGLWMCLVLQNLYVLLSAVYGLLWLVQWPGSACPFVVAHRCTDYPSISPPIWEWFYVLALGIQIVLVPVAMLLL
ncbi:hypothetical protein KIPB_005049 [Kipferlia bialata]|uniref:Uncharacterized protein n=1 Tax=Kipferlia bialata TaxID=797122 RepID=A0A391NTV9_9EUKA|nr:hypothetical protein KIPB_005049 [Kipferlia bialata]|eukprot:g5049.t1